MGDWHFAVAVAVGCLGWVEGLRAVDGEVCVVRDKGWMCGEREERVKGEDRVNEYNCSMER